MGAGTAYSDLLQSQLEKKMASNLIKAKVKINSDIALFVLVILAMQLVLACKPPCEEYVLEEVPSPSGKYVATYFTRNCGAVGPLLSVVSIRPSRNKFQTSEPIIFVMNGDQEVKVHWLDPTHLKIEYPIGSVVGRNDATWHDVHMEYGVLEPPPPKTP